MKRILTIAAFILGTSSLAHAGILIEPYLGYESGAVKNTVSMGGAEASYSLATSGPAFGLRLGYKFLMPWVALDYTAGSGKSESAISGASDLDYTKSSLGLVVGADLPIVHPYVGYGFSNSVTIKKGNTTTGQDYVFKGTYVKAGVGLGFIPFVHVNLEYKINTYSKVDLGDGAGEINRSDSIFTELKHDTVMVSVSVPFNL